MNKLILLVASLFLIACSGPKDVRPDIHLKGESLLLSGVIDYKKDKFSAAQHNFYRAVRLYQSIDNSKGMQLARINLLEALLAVNDFSAAEEQLAFLKQQMVKSRINRSLKERIILLEVKLLYQQQKYAEALAVIQPLLIQLDYQQIKQNKQIEWLATAARLETLVAVQTQQQWLTKFRQLMLQEAKELPKYQVILKRIDALIATRNQQYPAALALLHQALNYYKKQADRRLIAACLQEIAEIEYKQHHIPQAVAYLKRALAIRGWLKDQYHINKIQQRIEQIQPSL